MNMSDMKNMIVLKNLPSNLVDEAIIILKENKKKFKSIKKPKHKKEKRIKSKSKFSSKYQDRIESIRESEKISDINKKIHEKAKQMTDAEEKKEKEKFLKEMKK